MAKSDRMHQFTKDLWADPLTAHRVVRNEDGTVEVTFNDGAVYDIETDYDEFVDALNEARHHE